MTEEEARKLAEAHWEYTEHIIRELVSLAHYLYVEALVHGIKHGKEEK